MKRFNLQNSKRNSALKVLMLILLFAFTSQISFSQYQFKTYNTNCGGVSGTEFGRSIINRFDNGYAIAGYSYNAVCGIGPYDWMFTRIRPDGIHDLVKLIGTTSDDKCNSLIQSRVDKSYLLAGNMYDQNSLKNKATIVKLDNVGNLLYSRYIYDANASNYNQVVNDTADVRGLTGWSQKSGIFFKTRNRILVTQYNTAGNLNWGYRYDSWISTALQSNSIEEANSICYQPTSNTYGVAAKTNFYSGVTTSWDILLVNVNYSGAVIWKKVYKFNFANPNFYPSAVPTKIIPMTDGGFVVVGNTNAYFNGSSDIIVFRVSANGTLIWSNTYGTTAALEYGNSIVSDVNFLTIAGYRKNTVAAATDALLMKIPIGGGAPLWTRVYNPTTASEAGLDLVNSNTGAAGGYAVTGDASFNLTDAFLWRTDVNGLITGANCNNSITLSFVVNPVKLDSFLLVPVKVTDKAFNPTIVVPTMITNTYCQGDNPEGSNEQDNLNGEVTDFSLKQNYPNPFNPSTTIEFDIPASGFVSIKIFDISGKEVYTLVNTEVSAGRHKAEFNASGISTGVYYYKLVSGNFTSVKKMLLIK